MNTKEAIKELQDYFTETEWNDHAVRKVEDIIRKVADSNKGKIRRKYIRVCFGTQGIKNQSKIVVDFEAIAEEVCRNHGLPNNAIYSKNRQREYVHARADFVWRVKNANPTQSLKSIGTYMRRDHTTVIHLLNGIVNGHYNVGMNKNDIVLLDSEEEAFL